MTSPSGYWLQPGPDVPGCDEVFRRNGVTRSFQAGDGLDESMPVHSLRVLLQVGAEHLGRLGGAQTGEVMTADLVNRGLLIYLLRREERLQAYERAGDQ